MNILHISPYVPDKNASHAGGVCMGKEVETLSEKHNVYVMGFINDEKDAEYAKKFDSEKSCFIKSTTFTKAVNAFLHLNMPIMFGIRNSRTFKKLLRENIKKWNIDVIHAEYTAMGQFLWIKKEFPNIQFNLVEHDVVYQKYQRRGTSFYDKWQLKSVYKTEKKYCEQADYVFPLNDKDKKLIENLYGVKENVRTLTPYYGIDTFGWQGTQKVENSICFVGNMSREENDYAAKRLIRIFNEINQNNEYKLYIIGAYPSDELKNMANDSIIVTGFVDSIEKAIDQCKIAVFPLEHGAGIKFKVLQAFGLGLPVVTTYIGAEGIDEEGNALIIAEEDDGIKKAIIKLLNDNDYYEGRSQKSIKMAKEKFTWKKTEMLFGDVYNK